MLKKVFLTSIITLLLVQSCNAFCTYKKFNFNEDKTDPRSSKILYEYVLKKENKTPSEIKEIAGIEPESARAIAVDLNDDGTKEIIGLVYSTFYWGTAGYSLFILQKQPYGYKNITYVLNFEPQKNFYVLKTKTNGYKNIRLYGSSAYKFKSFTVKYEDGYYKNYIQIKSLEKALQQ